MGLLILIAGLVVMLGSHVFVAFRERRAELIARLGERGYRILFSVVSLVGLVLIVWGYADYRSNAWIPLWTPPPVMRHITLGLMVLAAILFVATYVPSHIRTWAKHPMFAAIKLWAFAHLLANGDLGSILLFGSFLAWAVYGRIAATRRADAGPPPAPAGWRNDILVVAGGIVLYLAVAYYFHPYAIGVAVLTG